jgi:hypothetical protein
MNLHASRFLLCALAAALTSGQVLAQLPQPRLDRAFPLGGKAGSEVQIEVSGKDLEGAKSLRFDHPGIKSEAVKTNIFKVTIAPDVPAGTYELRTVGTYGISGSRLFAVSRGLTEVLEKEPNDSPEQAQAVPMNSAINGNSDNNGDDYFRFPARKGERVTIDCQALRLDSTLRATLILSTAEGKVLAQSKPYYHRTDPFLDFVAPADGDYLVRLYDMTFTGGLPYRLIISNRPHIENVFPPAVAAGETATLTVLGRNLPGAKPAPEFIVMDQPMEKCDITIKAPGDAVELQRFAFINHPATPSLNMRGWQLQPRELEGALGPITLLHAPFPVVLEKEPNDTAETAQEIALPATVCGRFDKPGDADWYAFAAKAGEQIAVDLICERMEAPGDPFVIITDAKGNEVASFDDHGANINALAQFNRDPLGVFNVPADGTYRLLVQERYRNGGPRYQYVLNIGKAQPDFFPVVIHETNPQPSCPVVRKGGSDYCEICLNRRNFNGPVTVEAEGLPPGVTFPPHFVSPQTQFATLVFTAAPDAAEWAGAIRLKAWATIDGKRVEREVRCAQRRWNIANISVSRVNREICLAVRGTAPYAIHLPSDTLGAAPGGTVEFKIGIERRWADFKGKVQLTGLNLPPGFSIATLEVPPEKNEILAKLSVAANVPPGAYTVVLRGDAQLPFQRDPATPGKANVRVTDPSTALTVEVKK